MKAAVVEQIGEPLVVHSDWPDPECEAGDAVLRVEANGIGGERAAALKA